MTFAPDIAQRMRAYLDEVGSHLADRPTALRADLLRQLESHLCEALRQRGGDNPTPADLDAVLAEMDPPDSYRLPTPDTTGDAPAGPWQTPATPPPATCPGRRGDTKWFALALTFLLLNGWGVWHLASRPNGTNPGASAAKLHRQPLQALAAGLVSYNDQDAAAVLKITFNAAPSTPSLRDAITVWRDANRTEPVAWQPVGDVTSASALIQTTSRVDAGERLVIAVAAGLAAADARVTGTAAEQQLAVDIADFFGLREIEPHSPALEPCRAVVSLGKPVDLREDVGTFVSSQPPIPLDITYHYAGCTVSGDFEPGKVYALTLRKGLRAADGTTLAADVTRRVVFPDRAPTVTVPANGRYLSPRGALDVPLLAMNVRECALALRRVLPGNVLFFANRTADAYTDGSDLAAALAAPAVTNRVALPESPNKEHAFRVNLRQLAGAEPRGVYLLSATYPTSRRETDTVNQLVVVTDLGITAKTARDGVLVWVNALRTAQPLADVTVVLHARNNQELGRARTDAQGLAFIACAASAAPELAPTLVIASQGDDLSYLTLDEPVPVEGRGGDPYLGDGYDAFVFSDRGVYRPGETVHAKALVRNRELTPPRPFPALFRVVRPDGKVFREFPVTLDATGAAELAAPLPDYLPTGRYTIKLVLPGTAKLLGETSVALEEFVPPQIAVSLAKLPNAVTATDTVDVAVSARHLFGRPAADLPVSASVYLHDVSFTPDGWKGYAFGDAEKAGIRQSTQLGDSRLDANGQAHFTLAPCGARPAAAALEATLCATVTDAGGRTVAVYGNTRVDVYPFYVGLKPARAGGHVKIGEPLSIAVAAVTPDGRARQPAAPLLATVERVHWTSVMKRSDGRYAWHSERVKTRVGTPQTVVLKEGLGSFAFTAEQTGEYLVTLTDPFSGTSTSLPLFAAAANAEWVDWARDKPAQAQLSLDRPEYAPGQTARLAVKAPFSGTALLTVESDRVLEQRVITLAGNTAEFEIAVKPDYAPNVHCVLSVIRPAVAEGVWSAHRAVGSVVLKVVPTGHRLDVKVTAPATIRPQSRLTAQVKVADEAGRPVAGVALVGMAVDEGICMLTEQAVPDPLAYFLRTRALGVELNDLYAALMPESAGTADGAASHVGGDVGALVGRRLNPIRSTRFRPVALWHSGAQTDADGLATVTFDVPEFTGELRLTAVAYAASAFGAAKQPVSVKRPLVVQAELPRFLAPGDTCRLSLRLFNETDAPQQANWRVTCGGPLTTAQPEGTLALKTNAAGGVSVTLQAGPQPGKALCTVDVMAGTEHYTETFELAVRPALSAESRSVCAGLKPGEEARIAPPANWIAGTEFHEAWVSGQPDVKLTGGLDWLLRYPYGCCEQTVSSAFPLLHLRDLAGRVRPQGLGDLDATRFIAAGIYRLLSMQRPSGGFAMWPDQWSETPWASVYATHFLVEAKRAGQPVPEDRLSAALNYLHGALERPPRRADASDLSERAYICQVLALAGQPEHGWTARLLERADELSTGGRAHLAATLLASGKPREAVALLGEPGTATARQTPYDPYGNPTRNLALTLSAWLDIAPEHEAVPRLVHELEGLRIDGCDWWGTTQENAWALLALGKFARLTRPDKTPFAGELLPAGAAAVPFASDRELRWVSAAPGAARELRLVNRGPGTCWYGVRSEGVPTTGEVEPYDEGISIRREFFDQAGAAMDASRAKSGELIVVRLALDTRGAALDNLVIVDLLPAGWEVENPALATARTLPWVQAKTDWCAHLELRDDRVLLFSGRVSGRADYYYAVRAVTPGIYTLPPVRVDAMYQPGIRSLSGGGKVEVE